MQFSSALTIVIFNVFMCSIKYGFTLQDQFINVGRCFIKLFCWIKICFLFKNALLIKRYSFVPTKHYFFTNDQPFAFEFSTDECKLYLKRLEDKKGVTIYHYPYRFAKLNFHCDLYIKREHTNN